MCLKRKTKIIDFIVNLKMLLKTLLVYIEISMLQALWQCSMWSVEIKSQYLTDCWTIQRHNFRFVVVNEWKCKRSWIVKFECEKNSVLSNAMCHCASDSKLMSVDSYRKIAQAKKYRIYDGWRSSAVVNTKSIHKDCISCSCEKKKETKFFFCSKFLYICVYTRD